MKGKQFKMWSGILSTLVVVAVFSVVLGAMENTGKIDIFEDSTSIVALNDSTPTIENGESNISVEVTESDEVVSGKEDAVQSGELEVVVEDNLATSLSILTGADKYTSITDVVSDNGYIYAADATGKKLYKLNSTGGLVGTYNASSQVNGVAVSGSNLYLLEGELAGVVTVLNTSLNKIATIEVGHTPCDMVINGTTGYVANRFSNTVSVINLSTNTVTKTINIDGRETVALALANGKVYVACHLPEEGSTSKVIASNVAVINTSNNSVSKIINLTNGSGGVKDICASPDGSRVYVSQLIARYAYPTTQLDRGWINTNAMSIINTSGDALLTSVLLDEVELGASNPWGITVTGDGKKIVCALSGTDQAMVIDVAAMNNKIASVQNGSGVVKKVSDIPNYLPFLDNCRTRINLSGKGARAVYASTASNSYVYVGLYFDGSVDRIDLSNNTVKNYKFVNQPANDDVREGEILFHDGTLCYQMWQSCISCHPDARADGYNWDNLNDGLGNPKSAKSMLYSHRTPPVMVTGIRANAETAVRAGMKYIQFNALSEGEMAKIDEYLKALQPTQSPYLDRDGTLSASAERGKEIFNSVGCASCHPAPLYTDLKLHSVKATTDNSNWEYREMDTSTLVEVWRTGAWIYDGRFGNMKDTIRYYADGKGLTDAQITDLTNYVMSIGDEGEYYGVEKILVNTDKGNIINAITPGGKVTEMTVRRQLTDAPTTVNVTLTLESGGKILKTVTKQLTNVEYNAAKLIRFDTPISIPSDLTSGSTLTVSFTSADGTSLATDMVIKY